LPETREAFLKAIAGGSVISWQHINLLGEYDFSEERLQDSSGIKLPKLMIEMGEILGGGKIHKSLAHWGLSQNLVRHYVPLLEYNHL